MKTVCPSCRRIPIRFTANERHFPPILIQNILYQKPARSAIPPPRKKEKSTRVSPGACALPDAAHAKRALFPPKLAFGKEGGQACRSRPHKIPYKSPALPDFYSAARAVAARPPRPCRGVGGIVFGFSGTENVSRGDSVPPGITQPSHTSSCSPLRGRASSILMPSFADRPPYSTPYIASVIGMETPCCCARW